MKRRDLLSAIGIGATCALPRAWAASPAGELQCVVPAKPGGGFDVTCQLLAALVGPLPIVYHPGGIGALAYGEVVRGLRSHPRELLAFSSGTLLNLAQGRFGPWRADRIRWVAGIARDVGVVAVHPDAPWRSLADLLAALRARPASVAFAAGGTIGSQDWMKAALLAQAAGVSHKSLRMVAFEGGGDALGALMGRHVQVLCGDAGELAAARLTGSRVRLLAVLAPTRLDGALEGIPTALEQGVDVQWPILRGVYASADFPPADLAAVVDRIGQALRAPAHAQRTAARGLRPLALVGEALEREVGGQITRYSALAKSFGLGMGR